MKVIDHDKWDNMKSGLMVNLVKAKFTQNGNLKKMLMDTKVKQLGDKQTCAIYIHLLSLGI